jgi:hypothetical protein
MPTGYMVVAKDGQEYGPFDRDTIQQWYNEGRLDQNSKVCEPGKHKFRLKEVFDLAVWKNPALIARAAAASTAELTFVPKMMSELAGEEDRQPTPGMFAAGILLIINGVMGLLVIGLILTGQLNALGQPRGYIVPIIDLIVAAGLIRGNEKYRKWGLVRAVLGGAFFLLATLAATMTSSVPSSAISEISVATVSGWILVVFQLLFCAGIALLLWGDWPSKLRVGIGVAAVLIAWSGTITTSVVSEFVAVFKERAALARYSVASATFEDNRLGVGAKLPEGWALLTKENPIVPVPDATMIAVHNRSGCLAVLLVEPDSSGGTQLDSYLTLVLQNRQKATPTLKELGRIDVSFGGHQGRRLDTLWTKDGKTFRGFSTACKAGPFYYLLAGWCLDESFSKALTAFQSLEGVFEIGPRPATEPSEIALDSEEDFYELVFFIQENRKLPDGAQTILARGIYEGADVGFELSLGSSWRQGSLAPDLALVTYTGTASCRSVGAESDSLLQALDQLFGTKQASKRMKNEAPFSALSLEGDPRDLEKGPVKLKLFLEGSARNQYAELLTSIDLKSRKLYLSEKDPEYRGAIIRALQAR